MSSVVEDAMRCFEELLRSTVPPDRVEEVCEEAGRLRTIIALGTLCDDFRLNSSTLVVDALLRLHYAASPFRASLPIPQDAPATSKVEEGPLFQQYDPGGAKEPLFIHPSGELVRLLALRMRNWVHDQFDEYERSLLRLMDLAPSELDLFCAVGRRLQGPRLPRALGKETDLDAEQGLHEFVDAAVDLKLTVEALARGTDPDILSATGDVDQFTLRKICLAQAPSLNTRPQKTFTPDLVLFAEHPPGHLEPILQGESKRSVSATAPAPPPTPLRVPRASLATSSLARSSSSTQSVAGRTGATTLSRALGELSLASSPPSRFARPVLPPTRARPTLHLAERLQNLRSATPNYRGFKIGDIEDVNGSRLLIQKLLMISDSAPSLRSSLVNDTNSAFLVLHYRFAKSSTTGSSRTGLVLSANQSFEDKAFLQAVVALMLPAVDEPMLFNTVFLEDEAVSVTKAYSKEGYALHPRTSHDQPSAAQSSPADQLVDSPGSAAALALDAAHSASRSGVEQDERAALRDQDAQAIASDGAEQAMAGGTGEQAAQGGEPEQVALSSEAEQAALRVQDAQAMASGDVEQAAQGGKGEQVAQAPLAMASGGAERAMAGGGAEQVAPSSEAEQAALRDQDAQAMASGGGVHSAALVERGEKLDRVHDAALDSAAEVLGDGPDRHRPPGRGRDEQLAAPTDHTSSLLTPASLLVPPDGPDRGRAVKSSGYQPSLPDSGWCGASTGSCTLSSSAIVERDTATLPQDSLRTGKGARSSDPRRPIRDLVLRLRAVDAIDIRTSPTQSAACLRLCRVPISGPYEPVYAPFRGPPPSPTEPLLLSERVNDLYGRTSFVYFATHDDPPCDFALKQDSMSLLWHEAQVYHALAERDLHHIAPACLGLFLWENRAGEVWDEGQAPRKSGVLVTERCGSSAALQDLLSEEQVDTAVFLLEELHRAGFTHGDFARRNVVLDRRTGDLRLIDFAYAQPHPNCPGTELCHELRDARQSLRAS